MGNMKHHAIVVTGEEPAIRNAFRDVVDIAAHATASSPYHRADAAGHERGPLVHGGTGRLEGGLG